MGTSVQVRGYGTIAVEDAELQRGILDFDRSTSV